MKPVVEDVVAFFRLFGAFERELICGGTVTPAQCVLLQTLRGEAWDVSTLASHARVTKGAMTRLIDGLIKRGWVERTRDEADGRRVMVTLTRKGQAEAARLAQLTEDSVRLLMDRIPKNKRKQVIESIRWLRVAAEETRDQLDCC